MSDAAVDVFAEAFEEDQIRLAVAAAMAKLAEEVRGLPSPDPTFPSGYYTADMVSRKAVLALIEEDVP